MIKSKSELRAYIRQDCAALGTRDGWIRRCLDPILDFQHHLRWTEYRVNCARTPVGKLVGLICKRRLRLKGQRLGFSIPINVFGPGLSIAHVGTIVVNSQARVGANCRIHVCVNIGASQGERTAPVLGDNIYIAPGAKIFGGIQLGNDIAIAANAVVNKSFEEDGITIGGIPARKLSDGGASAAGWSPPPVPAL